MLLAFALLFTKHQQSPTVPSSVILAGYGLAIILLPLTGFIYGLLAIFGKNLGKTIPRWLFVSNIVFFTALLIFIFYANDPYYHQG